MACSAGGDGSGAGLTERSLSFGLEDARGNDHQSPAGRALGLLARGGVRAALSVLLHDGHCILIGMGSPFIKTATC